MLFKIAAVVLPTFAAVAVASAETKTERADALFREGRQLMSAGELSAACAKFIESNEVEASVGALLNLGECELRRDDPAAAWLAFRRAQLLARSLGDPDRAGFAGSRMEKTAPRLGFVTLEIAPRWREAGNLTVAVDGRPLLGPEVERPIPLNPGPHELTVTADGARPLERQVVGTAGTSEVVTIDLEPADSPAARTGDRHAITFAGSGTRKVVGVSMTAGGAVILAVSIGVGISARSQWNDVKDCRDGDPPCTPEEIERGDSARLKADIATGLFITGALVTGAGLALWLTAKPPRPRADAGVALTPIVGADQIGFAASGSF